MFERCARIGCVACVVALVGSLNAAADTLLHRAAGTLSVSPSCAGPQREGEPCSVPLAGAEVRLSDTQGRVVARTATDASGHFSLSAVAGAYRLHAGVGKLPRCPVIEVVLPMREPGGLRVECDSGMR